jgi:hypothetical protein
VSRLAGIARAALLPDLTTPARWGALVAAAAGSALTWRALVWLYVDFIRPRLDRFVRDSRLRSGSQDDALTLAILARNPAAFDAHIMGALDREAERFASAVGDALSARAAEHGAWLRERVFAPEIRETELFRTRIDQSQSTLDAVGAALEGVSAAQLAQGRALADMPRLSATIDSLAHTIESFVGSMHAVTSRLEALAVGQGEMRGALDIVRAIVLTGRPPEGQEERRHGPARRAEDVGAAALIHELREPPHAPDEGQDP